MALYARGFVLAVVKNVVSRCRAFLSGKPAPMGAFAAWKEAHRRFGQHCYVGYSRSADTGGPWEPSVGLQVDGELQWGFGGKTWEDAFAAWDKSVVGGSLPPDPELAEVVADSTAIGEQSGVVAEQLVTFDVTTPEREPVVSLEIRVEGETVTAPVVAHAVQAAAVDVGIVAPQAILPAGARVEEQLELVSVGLEVTGQD